MAETMTAEQVRKDHERRLGPTLGGLYGALSPQVAFLRLKWEQYRILFARSPARVELLNSVASGFFWVLQRVLWGDVLMHIARLTDPPSTGPKNNPRENLTLLRLPEALKASGLSVGSELSAEIETLVKQAEADTKFARDWRNRWLAHTDLDLALERKAKPLEPIAIHKVERALDAVGAVLKTISLRLLGEESRFECANAKGDAEHLVFYLKSAIDAEARDKEEILQRPAARKDKK